jgi:hypothetical protein
LLRACKLPYRDTGQSAPLTGKRADDWNGLLEEHSDLLKYLVEGSPRLRDTDPFAQQRWALENAGPEGRHVRYGDVELRVVGVGKGGLEIGRAFGRETVYICNP